jgi:hypothetical protein
VFHFLYTIILKECSSAATFSACFRHPYPVPFWDLICNLGRAPEFGRKGWKGKIKEGMEWEVNTLNLQIGGGRFCPNS